jgi:serine/threonine-protein kinase RsbW
MACTPTEKSICLRQHMPAKLDEINRVCEVVQRYLDAIDQSQMFFEVTLLLREALVNAVVHGSQADECKWIDIGLSLEGQDLVMDVQDQGPGFAWKKQMQQDASSAEDHGRGLGILQAYANEIQYNEKGNKVTLRKALAG